MSSDNTLTFGHLIIPVLGLLVPIIAIVAHYLTKAFVERQRHMTVREFARAGQPVPPELLVDMHPSDAVRDADTTGRKSRLLLPAFVNLGLGLGVMGTLFVASPGSWLWSIGFVPLGLGIALGLLWVLERRSQAGP